MSKSDKSTLKAWRMMHKNRRKVMSKENIIKTIEIEIAGVTVKVTPKEAKALHEALGELLNVQPETKIVEREIVRGRYPYPYWRWDTYTLGGTSNPQYDKWQITYSANTQSASLSI